MILMRSLLAVLLIFGGLETWAKPRPKPRTAAETEARNETGAPGLPGQVRQARRVTAFLLDALLLSQAQLQALDACTVAERAALALAVTEADVAQARAQYQGAVLNLLSVSQLRSYVALRQQLAGTMLPLDGTELAVR